MFVGGRRLRLGSVALSLAVMAALGACSGSSESPTTLPPVSAPPSTAPASQPPTDPKAAAVAVVREYFHLLNALEHDMNADAFVAITTNDCPCRAFAADVRKTAAKGRHYFGTIHLKGTTPAVDSATEVEVLAQYDSSTGGTATNSGRILFSGPRRTDVKEMFHVTLSTDGWRVSSIDILDKGHVS